MSEDLVQTDLVDTRCGHQTIEVLAEQIVGKLVYPIPREWVQANRDHTQHMIDMHEKAAKENKATIEATLVAAVAAERERCVNDTLGAAAKHIKKLRWERGTFPDRSVWTRNEAWAAIAFALESAAADLETLKPALARGAVMKSQQEFEPK